MTLRDRTNERHGQKREGALERNKSDVGEGRWARCGRIARASLSVTIGQTMNDAASVDECARHRRTVPVSNVLDSCLQNNMTYYITFSVPKVHVLVCFVSLLMCVTLRCLVLHVSVSLSVCVCISPFFQTHHTVFCNHQRACVHIMSSMYLFIDVALWECKCANCACKHSLLIKITNERNHVKVTISYRVPLLNQYHSGWL